MGAKNYRCENNINTRPAALGGGRISLPLPNFLDSSQTAADIDAKLSVISSALTRALEAGGGGRFCLPLMFFGDHHHHHHHQFIVETNNVNTNTHSGRRISTYVLKSRRRIHWLVH